MEKQTVLLRVAVAQDVRFAQLAPTYLQVLQPVLEPLHGFPKAFDAVIRISGNIPHCVLLFFTPVTRLVVLPVVGGRGAERQLGGQLVDGAELFGNVFLLL